MTDNTDNLGMPFIAPAQAQKHVTHNEALRMLDALVQISVVSRTTTEPPANPTPGARHLLASSGVLGVFAGHGGELAAFQDGAWAFFAPVQGWLVYVEDEDRLYAHVSGGWQSIGSGDISADSLGINATADAVNRLALASAATLLTHEGNGHQLKINKAAIQDTASLLYQTNYSGRAEMGLVGEDKWSIKVSGDGASWYNAITVDPFIAQTTIEGSFLVGGTRMHTRVDDGNYFWHGTEGGSEPSNLVWGYRTDGANTTTEVMFPPAGVYFQGVPTTALAANAVLDSANQNRLYRSTSKRAWKRDIEPMEAARAEAALDMEAVWYRSACVTDNPAWSWYGFIAEDAARIDPRLVHWGYSDEDLTINPDTQQKEPLPDASLEPQGVAYERLVVHHNVLIKQLFERIEVLEKAMG